MLTFIHAADLHLDSPLRGLSRHDDAPIEEIRGATRRALENLVDLAISQKVDFLLIAGDLYDGDHKDYSTALFFNQQMLRLKQVGIPAFLIQGNHDAASVITQSLTLPDNVHLFPHHEPTSHTLPNLPVTIHGQSFPDTKVDQNLSLNYPEPTPENFNIGLLHTSLGGNADHDTYSPCSLTDLTKKGYQYWALGHIHKPSILQKDPWIVYSGNTQGRKMNERGPRGCSLVKVDQTLNVTSHEFIPLDVVRWEDLALDLTSLEELDSLREQISEAIQTALSNAEDRLLALRLTLKGTTQHHGILHTELGRWKAEATALCQEISPTQLWLESLKLSTQPVTDLVELANRDDLTALVLQALENFTPEDKPSSITALESKLPHEIGSELDGQNPEQLREEISAIVLHSISMSSASDSHAL